MSRLFSLAKSVIRTYYKAVNSKPLWLVLNREAINLQKKFPPILDAIEKRVAEDLKRNGIAFAHTNELFPKQNMGQDIARKNKG